MLVAARSPVCIGVVPWPGRPQVWTVVVKRTYDVVARGIARLAERQQNLRVESVNERGDLVHPSDFVLTKRLCDVVLVGDALAGGGPARLAIEPVRKLVETPREVGPLRAPGDPSDPAFGEAWLGAHVDGDAAQCAPVDQRRPCTPLPFELSYDLGATRVSTRIEGPAPQVVLLDLTAWSAPRMIGVSADTILIDPAAAQIALLFRGCVEVHEGCAPLLVVETQQPVRSFSPRAMEQWPQAEAVEPTLLRRLNALAVSADLEATAAATPGPVREGTVRLDAASGGPRHAAPRAPSFGPPPPPREIGSSPPPAVAPPKPKLGGMMMLPLEVRSQPPPAGDALLMRGVQATLVDDAERSVPSEGEDEDGDDPLAGTVQAVAPPELRTRPLPFAPTPSGPPVPFVPAPAVRPPAHTLSVEEVAAASTDETLVRRGGALDVNALPFVTARPADRVADAAVKQTTEDDGPPTERPLPAGAPTTSRTTTRVDEEELGSGTVATTVPAELRALPFQPQAAARPFAGVTAAAPHAPPLVAPVDGGHAGFVARPASVPLVPRAEPRAPLPNAAPAPVSPPDAPDAARAATSPRRLTAEEFSAIRAELWGRRATRREVLAKHGFTELAWRLAERRFMKNLVQTTTPEKLTAVLSRLHVEAERDAREGEGEGKSEGERRAEAGLD
jgi:hypothetical protein